jgi:hypothetical protein
MFDSPDLPLATLRFDGPRFAGHSLDVECTRELIAYRTLVLECAKELWKRRHPDRARLPRNFDSGFRLDVDRIDPGSASLPLRRVRDHSQAALDFDDEFDEAAALIDDTIAAANQDRLLPEALPSNVVALFSDFGSSMRIDETLYLRSRRSSNEAAYTASARQRLANWVLPNYEDLVDITGEVRMANVGPGAFRLQLPDGGPLVEGRFEASHEAVVLQALKDHRQARLRVTGQGEFSTSERLRHHRSGAPAHHHAATGVATFRAQVDDPVGLGDHVQVVFDHHHAVAAVHQAVQHADELFHVGHVQAHGGLVQHVQRVRRAVPRRVTSSRTLLSSVTSLMRCASPPTASG